LQRKKTTHCAISIWQQQLIIQVGGCLATWHHHISNWPQLSQWSNRFHRQRNKIEDFICEPN